MRQGRAMTIVRRLSFTVQDWFESQISLCGTNSGRSNNGTGFSLLLPVPLVSIIQPMLHVQTINPFSRY
jgi:hypothetical protein